MLVVYANGSGTGSACCCTMYCPVFRCHQKSGSAIIGENQPISNPAASVISSGRYQAGVVAVIEVSFMEAEETSVGQTVGSCGAGAFAGQPAFGVTLKWRAR